LASATPNAAAVSLLLEHIAPPLEQLAVDLVQNVRVAFSSSLVELCPAFGKDTAQKLLVPLMQQLCKDDFHQVRNNIISKMDILAESLGAAGLTAGLLPQLLELAKDPKWRVRKTVVDRLGLLAKVLGVKTFEKKLQPVLIASLSDHVYAIRERACVQIGAIVDEFGGKWAAEKFFSSAFAIYDKTTNYLHRMTCLLIIQNCASSCNTELIDKHLLGLVITAGSDDVANVRVAASKTLAALIPKLDRSIVDSKVKPLLQKLTKDSDGDVSYFAGVALKICP